MPLINKFIIEGLDFLGKSTLIDQIQHELGFFQKIHYQKPSKLEVYDNNLQRYQVESFRVMFDLLNSHAKLILDRAHLGEVVYAPLYRGYSGDYVFNLEKGYYLDRRDDVRLILLTEDFSCATHFQDDGESFDIKNRMREQQLFIDAFNKSCVYDKRIICVTDPVTGKFKSRDDVLEQALKDYYEA